MQSALLCTITNCTASSISGLQTLWWVRGCPPVYSFTGMTHSSSDSLVFQCYRLYLQSQTPYWYRWCNGDSWSANKFTTDTAWSWCQLLILCQRSRPNTIIGDFMFSNLCWWWINTWVRDPVTFHILGIKYSQIFGSEHFNNKPVTKRCDTQTLLAKYLSEYICSWAGSN